jgi:magnesium-transporting ATPase (P-type)
MILSVLCGIVLAVATVIIHISPNILTDTDWGSEYALSPAAITSALIIGIATSLLIFILAYLVHRISSDMKTSHTPFRSEYARDIKRMAIILAIYAVFTIAVDTVFSFLWLDSGMATTAFGSNLPMLASAVIVYFLSLVFAYGTELQKTSDELL